ncbi:hypothetical protein Daus18300_008298 [Diaporthe australafricana]|uniref:Uncharacterized protein n=1 Tax=Diaporthe australafricana TaxID=127596 RepID=A0ABR3WIN1_9PEZI
MQNFIFFLMAIVANMVLTAIASPLATRGDAPPPVGGGLTWCYTNESGNLYGSTGQVLTDSNSTITWNSASGVSHTGYIYVHDVTGGNDEFWHDGAHYQDGWMFEDPLPVYYEYRTFDCGE